MSDALTRALADLRDAMFAACNTSDLAAIELATLMIKKTRADLWESGPNATQRDRMLHALGEWLTYQPHLRKIPAHAKDVRPSRNYYTADPSDTMMREIATRGWMTAGGPAQPGGLVYYAVTPAGFTALGLPQPKPERPTRTP